jgi:hypothetical protein
MERFWISVLVRRGELRGYAEVIRNTARNGLRLALGCLGCVQWIELSGKPANSRVYLELGMN